MLQQPGRWVLKVAVLSDIHGNAPALRAVLDELERRQSDLIVCCGDIAAGPMPRETIDELRSLGDRLVAVRGNADREATEVFDGHHNDGLHPTACGPDSRSPKANATGSSSYLPRSH